jgi:hypothetical protein
VLPKIDGLAEDIDLYLIWPKIKWLNISTIISIGLKWPIKLLMNRNEKGPAIVVDKFAGKCLFVSIGANYVFTWDAELGKNWIGDKNMRAIKLHLKGIIRMISTKKQGGKPFIIKHCSLIIPMMRINNVFRLA